MTTDAELKTVSYDKTGRIRIKVGDALHTLRLVKFGQYNEVTDKVDELGDMNSAHVERFKIVPDDPEEKAAQRRESRESMRSIIERKAQVIKRIFELFSDRPDDLPADIDDWPAWLVMDPTLLSDMIDHWRSVPLVRG